MSPVSLQPRTHRVSAFEQHELLKREGNTSKVHMHDSGTGDSSTPSKVEEPWDRRVKSLMDKHGISHDAAVTMLYRAEKAANGLSY